MDPDRSGAVANAELRGHPPDVLAVHEEIEQSALPEDRIAFEDRLTRGLWDAFPVSKGHLLIVPRRYVPTWFDATARRCSRRVRVAQMRNWIPRFELTR